MSSETQPPSVNIAEDAPQPHITTQEDFIKVLSSSPTAISESIVSVYNVLNGRLRELEQTISLLSQRVDLVNNRVDFQQKTLDVAAESVGQLVSDMNQIKRRYERNKRKHQNQFPKISPSQG